MTCPRCANPKSKVYGTKKGITTVRFRSCPHCGHTWKTKESVYVDRLNLEYVDYMRDIGEIESESPQSDPWDDSL